MKTFEIGVWEEQGGYFTIKAETRENAKKKAYKILEEYGILGNGKIGVRITHRDTNLVGEIT